MSKLEEMSIQGIRSFGPENPQRVSFSTPVTLILGPNGTGKTTIIECLKYAVTGELPPGAKIGASFIHDPKLTGSAEVKAKIALKAKDVNNCPIVAARNLVATQRGLAKGPSLKTLDGSIKRITPNGDIISHSLRVGEMDKEMASSLGASKSVFENVVFCHQEDSNWPLQEAKSVKERFDDLFASSRYVKALDALRKSKTDLEAKVRECRAELKHLGRSRDEANQVRHQKGDKERDLLVGKEKLSKVDEELDPICTQLSLYRRRYKELVDYQATANSLSERKRSLEDSLNELNYKIINKFEGSDEALNEAIDKADEHLAERQSSLNTAENDLKLIRSSIEFNNRTKADLLMRKTRLEVETQRLDEALEKRNVFVKKLALELDLGEIVDRFTNGQEPTASDVAAVRSHLEIFIKNAENQFSLAKATLESDSKKAQTRIDEARSALARAQQSITSQESTLSETRKELITVDDRLKQAISASAELNDVKMKLDEATKARELLESSKKESEIRESIEKAQAERYSYEDQIALLDDKIDKAQQSAMANQKRITLENDRITAIETAKKTVCVEGGRFSNSLTREFNHRLDALISDSKATQKNLNELQKSLSKFETEIAFHRNQLHAKQDAMRKIEENLISTCGSVNLKRYSDALLLKKNQLESDCAMQESSLHLWKKFCDRLSKESDCPLCHRSFCNEQDQLDLKEEIEKRIVSIPRDLDAKKRELQELTAQYEKTIELKTSSAEFIDLREREIPKLEESVKFVQLKLDELQSSIEKGTSKLTDLQIKESVARRLQSDMAVIEKTENEIAKLTQSLASYEPSGGETLQKSGAVLQEERQSLRVKCKERSAAIESLRMQLERLSKERQKAIDREHDLKSCHLKLEREFQAVSALNTELKRLELVKMRVVDQLKTLHDQLTFCQTELASAEIAKQEVSEKGEEHVAFAMTEWQKWRDRGREFAEACDAVVSKYNTDTSPADKLQQVSTELRNLEAKIEDLKSSDATTSERIQRLRNAISTHQIVQRELQDCIQLRKIQNELGSLSSRLRDVQEKISCQSGIAESTDIAERVERLSTEEERLRQKKQVVSDEVTRLKTQLQMMEKDLKEKYADAETEYLKKVYELRTSEMAATDLHRYHQALDRAIMKYHEEKMNEINDIIRELWRTTYRGNDIDHIMICSEEETLAANRMRRTYNYRVVMVKAGSGSGMVAKGVGKHARLATSETPLDMRGRCSAGQKVLASLVIRLALAEVFCLHCGVLALDEPTTNLDRENIESLAYALTEIIKTRSTQRNFQLIVITHDEDFIELLGRAGYTNDLQRLVRNAEGLSEIRTIRMEDHFN